MDVEPVPVRPIPYAESAAIQNVALGLARVMGLLGLVFGSIGLVLTPLVLMNYAAYYRTPGFTASASYRFLTVSGAILACGLDATLVAGSVMCLRLRPPGGRRLLLAYAWGHFGYAVFSLTGNLWWMFSYYGTQRMLGYGGAYLLGLAGTEFTRSARGVAFAVVLVVFLRRPEIRAVFRDAAANEAAWQGNLNAGAAGRGSQASRLNGGID